MKDWSDFKVNLIARGARFFFPLVARRRMATASPEKRERLQAMLAKMEAIQRDGDALLKTIHAEEIPRGTKIQEAMLEFNRKYAPDLVEDSERHLETTRAMEAESEHLKTLREADEDDDRRVAIFEEYLRQHPESRLGHSYLVSALTNAGRLDDALTKAREDTDEFARSHGYYHVRIAELLLKKQDWDGAIAEARLANQKAEEHNKTLGRREKLTSLPGNMALAEALLGKGERRKAKRIYKECLRYSETDELKKLIRERMTKLGL
jgi:tetratricopeptide (TPR) repeat protein